jgi:sulfite exporter TauE/SafE
MKGWKTWAAAIGMILGGLGQIVGEVSNDSWSFESVQAGYAMIMAGLGLIGIGHKVEKNAKTSS